MKTERLVDDWGEEHTYLAIGDIYETKEYDAIFPSGEVIKNTKYLIDGKWYKKRFDGSSVVLYGKLYFRAGND